MNKLFNKIFNNEHGQIIIFFPLLFIVLCGLIGLALDTSWIIYNKHKLQNSTDLAALSGAQYLPSSTSKATSEALLYLQKNYEKNTSPTITLLENNYRMDIYCKDNINLLFLPIFGIKTTDISAVSGVKVIPIKQPSYMVPIGIHYSVFLAPNFDYNTEISLYAGGNYAGNFGLIDPTTNNLTIGELTDYIANDYKEKIPSVGSSVNVSTGFQPLHLYNAFNQRLMTGKYVVICAIVDFSNASGSSKKVPIMGYAAFYITSIGSQGNNFNITGRFIEFINPEGIPGNTTDYGVRSINLIK